MAKQMKGVTCITRKGTSYWYAQVDGRRVYCGKGEKGRNLAEAARAGSPHMWQGPSPTVGAQQSGEKPSAPQVVSLGVQGTTVHAADSHKDLTIDLKAAKDAGEKVSVEGSSVRFDKGQTSISVATNGAPQTQDGQITGQVESIAMKSAPVGGQFADAGIVSASFHADLKNMPSQDATVSSVLVNSVTEEENRVS
jgi:hypothetical protein